MLALSLGAANPHLPGPHLVDGDGRRHPGLFPDGLPILGGKATEIVRVREEAAADSNILLIDFPAAGQTATDYEEFRGMVGVLLHGVSRFVLPRARKAWA